MTSMRERRHAARPRTVTCAAIALFALAGCAPTPSVGTGAFRNAADVSTRLQRGVSTKSDVQNLLGVPNGDGSSLFRNVAGGPRQIWYYEDLATTDASSRGGVMTIALRQQILLVFFKGDVFDGYLWTSNNAPASIR